MKAIILAASVLSMASSLGFTLYEDFRDLSRWENPITAQHLAFSLNAGTIISLKSKNSQLSSHEVGGGLITSTQNYPSHYKARSLFQHFSNENTDLYFMFNYRLVDMIECSKLQLKLINPTLSPLVVLRLNMCGVFQRLEIDF